MASFFVYDIVFLALFLLAFTIFFVKRRSHFKRQGMLYLYRTNFGIEVIDNFTKKYEKILRPLQYVVVLCGYILMVSMVWFIAKFAYSYLASTELVRALKVPVVMPLIPYLPELFKIDFLPPFYFTYWIVIIALIAIPHEFAHGIFARLHKVTVHSTGFGFLGPFLAAFVEPDEKQMKKKGIFAELAMLAAGTFANIISALVCALLLWAFFASAFTAQGITFNSYATTAVNVSDVTAIGGVPISNFSIDEFQTNESMINITTNSAIYSTSPAVLGYMMANKFDYIMVYDDTPAFNARIQGAITAIDSKQIRSYDDLRAVLSEYSPGDNVTVHTLAEEEERTYDVTLGDNNGAAFLGIGAASTQRTGLLSGVYNFIASVKDPNVQYESKIGNFGMFIYDLLWWSVLICISVALVNMLPMGLFDGGRFFYLTVLALTRKQKVAEWTFKIATWLFLALVALLTIKWIFAYI